VRLTAPVRRPVGDDGTITLLVVGLVVIATLLISVAIDVSMVFLARQRMASQADGAALAAAQQVDDARYFDGADCLVSLPVTSEMEQVVERYARDGVRLEIVATTVDGGPGVEVHAESTVDLPLVSGLGRSSFTIEYAARARSSIAGADC
jgi:hypothetical protein